jgi:formate hydrogenlyase subunit 4
MDGKISLVYWLISMFLAPLLSGVINRTKAFFAGRKGQPLLQPYYDLYKLLNKGAVYSRTATWVFRAGPVIGLSAVLVSLTLLPAGGVGGMLTFPGDFVLLAYLLGLARFAAVSAALDTGSAFEGMGACREVQFSLLAEIALLLGFAVLAAGTGQLSLSGIFALLWSDSQASTDSAALLVAGALLIVLLAENARIPVDDPNTHLELTMIHEVMVLDHGGVDLAFIEYGAALKLWLFSSLLVGLAFPLRTGKPVLDIAGIVAGVFASGILLGGIESTMARLRLLRVPQMLLVALALSLAALFWVLR